MTWFTPTYRVKEDGTRINGVLLPAFRRGFSRGDVSLLLVGVFQDGMIDCCGLMDYESFKHEVRVKCIVTRLPKKASVRVGNLAQFTATVAYNFVRPEEFIKEVADEIEQLNGRSTSSDRCRDAWTAYNASPTRETKQRLRKAYEAIPEHNRRYVLKDFDNKDLDILYVLRSRKLLSIAELFSTSLEARRHRGKPESRKPR
jgi:hypothetical protein